MRSIIYITTSGNHLPHSLRRFVDAIWISIVQQPDFHTCVVPDGCTDLIWHYHENRSETVFVGPMRKNRIVYTLPGETYIGVRFRPGVRLKRDTQPMSYLCDQRINRSDPDILVLQQQLQKCLKSPKRIVQQVEQWLRELYTTEQFEIDPHIERCIVELHNAVTPRLTDIYKGIPLSERTIQRRFVSVVGITPKYYLRINRYQRTSILLRQSKQPLKSMTQLALDMGYADHSHMIREFQHFIGMTPHEFLAKINL